MTDIVKRTVKEIIDNDMKQFAETIMTCSSCRHMGICEHMKPTMMEKTKEFGRLAAQELDEKTKGNIISNEDLIRYKEQLEDKYHRKFLEWQRTIDKKCFYEIKLVVDLLSDFDTYGLDDPAMKLSVKVLISNMIMSFRMDIIMKHYDIFMDETRTSASGDSYKVKVANPLIKYRNEINKQILDTSEKLYRLVHGTKQVSEKTVTVYDILSNAKPKVVDE